MKNQIDIELRPNTLISYIYENNIFLLEVIDTGYYICISFQVIGRDKKLNLNKKSKKEKEQILSLLN
jgi:hypothetical protein